MASNGSTFSYAQAAKGLAPSTQNSSVAASSSASENGGKDAYPVLDNAISEKSNPSVHASEDAQLRSINTEAAAVEQIRKEDLVSSVKDDATRGTEVAGQSTSSTFKVVGADIQSDSAMIQPAMHTSQRSSQAEIPAELGDHDRAKDMDDDWEKVSIPSVTAEREFKAAPIPSFNIWQQRKEAQDAKFKDNVTQRPLPNVASSKPRVSLQTSGDETRRRQNNKDSGRDVNSTPRRVNSGGRAVTDRRDVAHISPRAYGQSDSHVTSTLRSATDAESWPTPDTTTTTEERRRSSVIDKSEKPEIKAGGQKKWVQMAFVPTAKFETQLPPAAARRGGRPANRGRDGAGRGGISSQNGSGGEKLETGVMGPPPLSNKVSEQDRGRRNTGVQNSRASSVPSHGPRTASNEGYVRENSRYSVPHNKTPVDNPRASEPLLSKATIATGGDEISVTGDSRSSSRHDLNQLSPRKAGSDRKELSLATSNHGNNNSDSAGRSQAADKQRGQYQDSGRASLDHTDKNHPSNREWSRSRPDVSREKNELWRGRESRPERARGGYRGRGNHSSYNHNMSPSSYTPSLGQNGFEASKQVGHHEGRSTRQSSQPFPQSPSVANNRNNPRSQSIPVGAMQGGYYSPVPGFPPAITPTEMRFNPFPQQMHGGIMSAMPYADQLNSFALISMVITQLEYYFSIDNLCKDMFLRKNMDSQGFVPLGVIANFKRIKALTDGQMAPDQLRSVCQQVRNVEFVTGEDGEDKLRSRENWRDFILPIDERLPSAQNDGPSILSSQTLSQSAQGDYPNANGGLASPTSMNDFMEPFNQALPPMGYPPVTSFDGSGEFASNGSHAQHADQVRRSSATSPFTNAQSPPALEHLRTPSTYIPNGHNTTPGNIVHSENIFPDEKIPELKVVVRDPAFELSNSRGGAEQGSGVESSTSLRGGAANPDQLNTFQPVSYTSDLSSPSNHDSEQSPYWTKDGEIGQIPTGPGFVHEDYLPLRDKALAQRLDNHLDGALRVLYAFWSSFLVEHFNLSMYEEFSALAKEDLESGSETGKVYLVKFYDTLLTGKNVMSERIAADIVALARHEAGERRPLWQKLRAAWRNGATNMKTRKRLGDVLTDEEKTDFDKIN